MMHETDGFDGGRRRVLLPSSAPLVRWSPWVVPGALCESPEVLAPHQRPGPRKWKDRTDA